MSQTDLCGLTQNTPTEPPFILKDLTVLDLTAIRENTGLSYASFLLKGKVSAYVGLTQKLKDLHDLKEP